MFNNFKDYGIIILKPDGVKKNLMDECEKEILKHNIKIIAKKQILLTRQQIIDYFYYNFEEYVDYMCEGVIIAYFLEAYNIDLDVTIYLIKKKIRDNHGVNGRIMRNYIHGSHCGTEFFLQRRLLFPEFEKYEYSSGLDMYCKIDEFDLKIYNKIRQICEKGKVSKIIFDIPAEQEQSFCDIVLSKKLNNFVYFSHTEQVHISNSCCDIIYYYPNVATIKKMRYLKPLVFLGEVNTLNLNRNRSNSLNEYNDTYMAYVKNEFDNIINQLKKKDIFIEGILINTSGMSLQEAECRYEYAHLKKYLISGGSSALNNLGLFTMSYNKVKPIMKYLNDM